MSSRMSSVLPMEESFISDWLLDLNCAEVPWEGEELGCELWSAVYRDIVDLLYRPN